MSEPARGGATAQPSDLLRIRINQVSLLGRVDIHRIQMVMAAMKMTERKLRAVFFVACGAAPELFERVDAALDEMASL